MPVARRAPHRARDVVPRSLDDLAAFDRRALLVARTTEATRRRAWITGDRRIGSVARVDGVDGRGCRTVVVRATGDHRRSRGERERERGPGRYHLLGHSGDRLPIASRSGRVDRGQGGVGDCKVTHPQKRREFADLEGATSMPSRRRFPPMLTTRWRTANLGSGPTRLRKFVIPQPSATWMPRKPYLALHRAQMSRDGRCLPKTFRPETLV